MVRGQFPGLRKGQDAPAASGFHHPAPVEVQEADAVSFTWSKSTSRVNVTTEAVMLILLSISVLSAILWHWIVPGVISAVLGATITTIAIFQIVGYLQLGYLDP